MAQSILSKFESYLLTEKRVSANTFGAYLRDVVQFVQFLEKQNTTIEKAEIKDLKEFLHYLKNIQALSARSITRKISALKVLFAFAYERFGLKNLAEDLTFPKLEKRLPDYLSEDEIELLLSTADKNTSDHALRNKIMLYLLYVSGMRISELTKLTLSQIHFDTGFVQVEGKGGKGRMIPITGQVLTLVRDYIDTTHRTFSKKHTTDYLFPILYAGTVRPITRQAFWGILKQLCKKAGIERPISPHKLRHSLATHMLKHGADLRSLQMLLGHENLATVQIYTHLETSYLRNIYDKKHPRS